MNSGIYIHIPFCEHKCGYCDFYSSTNLNVFGDEFVKALCLEIEHSETQLDKFNTLFFGGGTPTLLSIEQFELIFSVLHNKFNFSSDTEITLEANPETVDFNYLKALRETGFNRISFGVQSFRANELKFMERIHSGEKAKTEIRNARKAGFDNISCDLIFGLPDQTLEEWKYNLDEAISLGTDHISAYSLIYEQNTRFGQLVKKNEIKPISQDFDREIYEFTISHLKKNGFNQYETSNYSKSVSKRSQHNLKYWKMDAYVGFGPSAHSFDGNFKRHWNIRSTEKYIQKVNANESTMINSEVLEKESHIFEWIMLGFRMNDGVSIVDFRRKFNLEFNEYYAESIKKYSSQGLLELTETHCRLTNEGLFYSDYISSNF